MNINIMKHGKFSSKKYEWFTSVGGGKPPQTELQLLMAEKFLPPIFIPVFESAYPRYLLNEILEKSENWKVTKIY